MPWRSRTTSSRRWSARSRCRSSPTEAWRLVTEPEHLEQWFAREVELEPEPGAPVRVIGDDGGERHGVVEEVDAPRRLRFVWYAPPDGPPSSVEIEVTPASTAARASR